MISVRFYFLFFRNKIHVKRRRIDIRTELKRELELQNQHSEIEGHVPQFTAQALAPMMQYGVIASINGV